MAPLSFLALTLAKLSLVVVVNGTNPSESVDPHDDEQQLQQQRTIPHQRIGIVGLEQLLNIEQSLIERGIFGLSDDSDYQPHDARLNYKELHANDMVENSLFDPLAMDSSCLDDDTRDSSGGDCWHPPVSTVQDELVGLETLAWGYGGNDPDDALGTIDERGQSETPMDRDCRDTDEELAGGSRDTDSSQLKPIKETKYPMEKEMGHDATFVTSSSADSPKHTVLIDKHWGSDPTVLKMRDRLSGRRSIYWERSERREEQQLGTYGNSDENEATIDQDTRTKPPKNKQSQRRPPVFLIPGLASTRLVSWKHKPCPQNPLLSDIKMLDYVWLNMNLLIQMATIDVRCWSECMTLAKFQRDFDEDGDSNEESNVNTSKEDIQSAPRGCKLRPDEGLDAISSLAPGSISSSLLVGGTNTVYAWLIQWLADNLGYDVSSIVALPYDWRLSPDRMEERDGFLTLTRAKIEAAVKSNGLPGIVVAHSMGNSVFRYFQEWLRVQMREEVYERYVQRAEEANASYAAMGTEDAPRGPFWRGRSWVRLHIPVGSADNRVEDQFLSNDQDGNNYNEPGSKEEEAYVLHPLDFDDNDIHESVSSTSHSGRQNVDGASSKRNDEMIDRPARKYPKLWEIAKVQGDGDWIDWLGKHIWTYVGLGAPLLGAPGPLRSVLSGENMGLPFTDDEARGLKLSFGSTSTVNPISTKMGFCDGAEDIKMNPSKESKAPDRPDLTCLDELVDGIESVTDSPNDPWMNFPALRLLLKDRVDFDSGFPMIRVEREYCLENEKSPCENQTTVDFGPKDVMSGRIFHEFSKIWNEENDPLRVKYEQLRQSWWNGPVPNPLMSSPERPHIKHVIMAYGTEVPTEAGYIYRKKDRQETPKQSSNTTGSMPQSKKFDGVPSVSQVIWEEKHGRLISEPKLIEPVSFTETILRKKKLTRRPFNISSNDPRLHQSGDGTIPYISLMWAHTWLLHATRATKSSNQTAPISEGERITNPNNALDSIKVTHRPKGGNEWLEGYGADPRLEENMDYESRSNIGDTGTQHPHGTQYKPKMVRFQSSGKSRSTGMEYTTTVIEAIGVEHKETTRNYDILAAAFTEVLKNLHEDYEVI